MLINSLQKFTNAAQNFTVPQQQYAFYIKMRKSNPHRYKIDTEN